MAKRTQRVNGFVINIGKPRKPRGKRDYKERKGPYKTKQGAVWKQGKYYRKGSYKGKPRGWIKYKK